MEKINRIEFFNLEEDEKKIKLRFERDLGALSLVNEMRERDRESE